MAGGEGSRLRPLTSRRPKPLVPVAGRPIMEHILLLLRDHGITDVVVTLMYLGAEIRNHFGDGGDFGMNIEYVVEDQPLGTAGSVRNAAHLLDDTFLVISGDALTDIDLTRVIDEHRRKGAEASLVLYSVPNPLEYGVVVTEADGAVRRFIEKPSWGEVISDQANTGIYVIEPQVLDLVPPGVNHDWSQDVFPALLRRRSPLYGIVANDYWCDVGTIQSYLQANWDALEGRVRVSIPGRREEGNVWLGEDVELGPGARIEGPAYIGDEARVGTGAFINGPAVIGSYCVVDSLSKISNSVIWAHSYIGESTRLRQSIVCKQVTVKNNCLLEDGVVVGDDCVIGQGAHLRADVKLWPNKEVQPGSAVTESIIWAGEWRSGLFSAYGLTGIVNVELTPEFSARLGAAFAATLPKGATVAINRDASRAARMIKRAMISGLASAGARVRDLSEGPLPLTQIATAAEDCAAGVHIMSSPLDPRSADIRLFDVRGMQIDKRGERKVENLFFREDFRRVRFDEMGDLEYYDPIADYLSQSLRSVDVDLVRSANLRVVVDYDYSSASIVLPELLNRLGVTAVPLHAGFGERFPSRPLEQFRAAVDDLALVTRTLRADAGCLLSSAGDRLWLADDSGAALDDHRALGVFARLALEKRGGGIVMAPAHAPHWLQRVAEEAGGQLRSTKAEPGAIVRAAVDAGAVVAGDAKGGVCFPDHLGALDAMHAIARLLELCASAKRPLSEVVAGLPTGAYMTRSEFCPWDAKGRVMRVLVAQEQERGSDLDLVDGIKVLLPDGYVLILPDPDTPYYQVVVSVDDRVRARELVEEYARRVREAQETDGPVARMSVLDKVSSDL